jgi:hypothetical protein
MFVQSKEIPPPWQNLQVLQVLPPNVTSQSQNWTLGGFSAFVGGGDPVGACETVGAGLG